MTKAIWGGKGSFGLHFHITVHHRSQDRNSNKAGADAETHGGVLLTGLLSMACSDCFLVQPGTTYSGVPPYSGLGPPHQSLIIIIIVIVIIINIA